MLENFTKIIKKIEGSSTWLTEYGVNSLDNFTKIIKIIKIIKKTEGSSTWLTEYGVNSPCFLFHCASGILASLFQPQENNNNQS